MFRRSLIVLMALTLFASACGDSSPDTSTEDAEADTGNADSNSGDTRDSSDSSESSTGDGSSTADAVANAMWGDNVSLDLNGDTVTITSDGIPNHEYPDQWAAPNETTTDTDFGLIGLIISGAALFDPYEGGGGVALDGNFDLNGVFFIDACNGHPQNQGAYHYHGVPYCITDVVDVAGEHSTMIGVLLDGFPVYGPQDNGGDAPNDLDECHGHVGSTPEFPDGIYHYHLIESDVYSVRCYHGVVAATAPS